MGQANRRRASARHTSSTSAQGSTVETGSSGGPPLRLRQVRFARGVGQCATTEEGRK